jgi:hypothetical protein
MADWIRCKCGARYRVLPANAGTARACDECGTLMQFPQLDREAVEMLEEVGNRDEEDGPAGRHELEDEDEEEDRVVSAQKRPPKRKRSCFVCDRRGKGSYYTFFAGKYRYSYNQYGASPGAGEPRSRMVVSAYTGMHKTGIFLCRACARGAWRRKYLVYVIALLIPALLCFFGALALSTLTQSGPRAGIVPLLLVGCAFLLGMLVPLYWVLFPSMDRDIMERICITLSRRDKANEGDSFFTKREFDAYFGGLS